MAVNASSIQIEAIGGQASVPKGKAPPLLAPFVSAASAPSPPKTAVLIYNPFGGKKKAAKLVETIVMPMLVEAGVTVDVKPTTHAGHAAELGRTYPLSLPGGTPVDALIAVGGDGTLSELLDGFIQRTDGASCTIGFIPAGTGNTYMHEALGVKTMGAPVAAVRTAVQAIIEGRSRKVDCQQLDMAREDGQPLKKISINTVMAGFGPDTNAVAEKRRWLGAARYNISVKTEILKLPWRKPLASTLTFDDGPPQALPDLFLFGCFVNKFTGTQHRICPYAQLDDGKLDIVFTNAPVKSIPLAAKIDGLVKGGGKHVHEPVASLTQVRKMKIETATPARLMVDGDIVGFTPLTITALPGTFSLYTLESPAPS